jgi:hypothetical protein
VNQWDKLSGVFGDYSTGSGVPSGIADNILIAWLSILGFVNRYFKRRTGICDSGV